MSPDREGGPEFHADFAVEAETASHWRIPRDYRARVVDERSRPVYESTSERLDHALETLAAIARIESLQNGVVAFELPRLEGGKWYESEEACDNGWLDQIAIEVPYAYDEDDVLDERCRLALRHALEDRRFELARASRAGVGKPAEWTGLLAAVEGHLVALGGMRLPSHAIRNAEAQEVTS